MTSGSASDGTAAGAAGGDELRGFGPDARRAVALAETEARGLGHDRVGTEHLLLGVLTLEGGAAAQRLQESGITLTSARHKVAEAVPRADAPAPADMERTERAARALGRAHRFCHASRSATVGAEHVLLGVLDVEGTAGQVLRGLGADVERLRTALRVVAAETGVEPGADESPVPPEPEPEPAPVPEAEAAGSPAITCPGCGAALDDAIDYRVLIAAGPRGPREVVAYSCRACGRALGAAPG